jgi:Carboxypeptidase regulatory-like domain
MIKAIPSALRSACRLVVAVAAVALSAPGRVGAQTVPKAATTGAFTTLQGFVMDSVHGAPLVNAKVSIVGTTRSSVTDADGHYRIDSIPPGSHSVVVEHPVLDTIGVQMRTPAYAFGAGESRDLDLAIPTAERIATAFCTSAMRMRGPAAMVGFVRDPDTKEPAVGSKVQLVYYEPDPIGRRQLRTREVTVDSTGLYRICGLPGDMSGKVQVFRNGVSSGEVPAEVTNGFLALRAFSIASQHATVVEVKNDSGKVRRIYKGTARVTGRVLNTKGQPLNQARVMLQGGGETALTKPDGSFALDSLPSGTQALEIRKLGYSVTEVPIELSSATPAKTTITMSDAVPLLATMRVEAARDKGLADVGFRDRKQMGMGYFMEGNQINRDALSFSDVMRVAPGLRISPTGDGRTYTIQDARNATGGCVNYYVDNTPWQTMTPGDIDDFVRPSEIVAVEVYHGSETPPQFTQPGQSGCATIVVWTVARIHDRDKR